MKALQELLYIKQYKERTLEATIHRLDKKIAQTISTRQNTFITKAQLREEWQQQNQRAEVFNQQELLIQKEKLNQYHQQDLSLESELQMLKKNLQHSQEQLNDFKKQLFKNRRSQEKLQYLFNELMENL